MKKNNKDILWQRALVRILPAMKYKGVKKILISYKKYAIVFDLKPNKPKATLIKI